MRRPLRPKAEADLGERRLENRFQNLPQCLLTHPINYRENAERTFSGRPWLFDLNPTHRQRAIPPVRQSLMQNREITAALLPEPVNADPVHTTGTAILPNPIPGPPKILRVIDLPDQRVRLPHLHTFIHYLAHHGAIPSILIQRRLGHCLGNHQSDAAYSPDITPDSPFPP
jgi:hypothetical protein